MTMTKLNYPPVYVERVYEPSCFVERERSVCAGIVAPAHDLRLRKARGTSPASFLSASERSFGRRAAHPGNTLLTLTRDPQAERTDLHKGHAGPHLGAESFELLRRLAPARTQKGVLMRSHALAVAAAMTLFVFPLSVSSQTFEIGPFEIGPGGVRFGEDRGRAGSPQCEELRRACEYKDQLGERVRVIAADTATPAKGRPCSRCVVNCGRPAFINVS